MSKEAICEKVWIASVNIVGESIVGNAYRVTSEEEGISLLDMIVCSLCFIEAKSLRLHAEESMLEENKLQLETEGCIHSTERG